ncbi:MAG TPA: TIR domain-containing protein [Terricaulis sp.]|nr:TIR domain-containing protein [Terricaulis sp.]
MADVFLSYKREDQQIARDVAADLEAEGYSVFFDVRIEVGDSWDATIERELNAAKAAVVLWSAKSRESKWVRREAREAMARGILCPAMISRCKIPLEFSDVQTADLIGRRAGDRAHAEWRRLCDGVGRCVGRKARGVEAAKPMAPTKPETPKPASPPHSERRETAAATPSRRALAIGGAAVLGAVAIGGGYYGWTRVQADGVARAWEEARAAGTRRAVRAFLRAHPDAPQAGEARATLASLPLAVREAAVLRGHESEVLSAEFSPDGKRFVTSSNDQTARVWDASTLQEVAVLRREQVGARLSIWNATFSPDSTQVATADISARIWDATTGRGIADLYVNAFGVLSVAFDASGTHIATGCNDGVVRLWEAIPSTPSRWRTFATLRGHENFVRCASFNSDGTRVVSASYDHTARVWDAVSTSRQQLATLSGHEHYVVSAAFDRAGARIVTASWDTTARVWDAYSAHELLVLRGHLGYLSSAKFSQDGLRIVTAGDQTARVWDSSSGREIAALTGHQGGVNSAAFSPDGTRIITASDDRTARIWTIDEHA